MDIRQKFIFFLLLSLCYTQPEKLISTTNNAHPLLAQQITKWISSLENNDKNSYNNLVKIGQVSQPYLYAALHEKINYTAKKSVIQIIEKLNLPSENVLLKCIQNDKIHIRVREQVIISLAKIGTKNSLPLLIKIAFDRNNLLYRRAATTINKIAEVEYLVQLLQHWERDITKTAHKNLLRKTKQKYPANYNTWKKWWKNNE
ncbi:HEAT repeat domain-containing protein [Candidatus Uabimicrobium sp. HlEnr_7]|uniref:HEAT repeat domain-containing protein n=1 Tax=Candidatus Uabimicrobium helgolandensis TaxID=3095367 RepID=UPI00355894C4